MRTDDKTFADEPVVQQIMEHTRRRVGPIQGTEQMKTLSTEATVVIESIGNGCVDRRVRCSIRESCVHIAQLCFKAQFQNENEQKAISTESRRGGRQIEK